MEMDVQVKLAVAMAIIRSRSSQLHSTNANDLLHWKKKAKERKKELDKLKHYLNEIQDGLLSEMLSQIATCKCYFFESSGNLNSDRQFVGDLRESCSINQVLFRQFLRQVRLREKIKHHKDTNTGHHFSTEFYADDEKGKLLVATSFLVEFINVQSLAYNKNCFATFSHQAVDFIKETLQGLLEREDDEKYIVDLINNLVFHLIKSICCTTKQDDLDDTIHDNQFYVQHVMRKLAELPYIGQRILLLASQRMASVADSLLCMDPFDATTPLVHNSLFVMMQLVEFLVSDYTYSWVMDPSFSEGLLEEWIICHFQMKKAYEMLETRNSLYTIYIDRITGELAKQLNKISSLEKHNQGSICKLLDVFRSCLS